MDEPAALEEVADYPRDPPPWLTPERFRSRGPFHRFVAFDARTLAAYEQELARPA